MYYIKSEPNESGNHGNPMGHAFPGAVTLPDGLLPAYLDAKGFVSITLDGGTVESVEANQAALEAYNREHPEVPEEPAPPTVDERISDLEAKHVETEQTLTDMDLALIEAQQSITDLELSLLGGDKE